MTPRARGTCWNFAVLDIPTVHTDNSGGQTAILDAETGVLQRHKRGDRERFTRPLAPQMQVSGT